MMNSYKTLTLMAACAMLWSCDTKDPEPWSGPVYLPVTQCMYVLNQGCWNSNNASISLYPTQNETTPSLDDFYYRQNGKYLGDMAQDLIRHGDAMYVAVNGSNYVAALDMQCVEQARVSFASDPQLQGGVRSLAGSGDAVYATCYGGYVVKLDAGHLTVESKIKVGNNLEGIAALDGQLYVADSYKIEADPATGTTSYVYQDKLYVIDTENLSTVAIVNVAVNPNRVVACGGKIFVISWGNYADKGYQCQMIDPQDNYTVTDIAVASDMAAGNGKLYLLYAVNDWATNQVANNFMSYDIAGSTLESQSFLTNAPAELAWSHIYMMSVDPITGDIYLGTTDYVSTGELYRFDKDGKYAGKFGCGGVNPWRAVYF